LISTSALQNGLKKFLRTIKVEKWLISAGAVSVRLSLICYEHYFIKYLVIYVLWKIFWKCYGYILFSPLVSLFVMNNL
jgi:hypothetical protein